MKTGKPGEIYVGREWFLPHEDGSELGPFEEVGCLKGRCVIICLVILRQEEMKNWYHRGKISSLTQVRESRELKPVSIRNRLYCMTLFCNHSRVRNI